MLFIKSSILSPKHNNLIIITTATTTRTIHNNTKSHFSTNNHTFYTTPLVKMSHKTNNNIQDEALRFTSTQRRRMTVAKTFSRQNEVPRLPLPTIEKTIEKYLVTVQPYFANETEMMATKKAAEEFLIDPEIKIRQAALEKIRNETPNGSWLERMWLDVGYHQWRAALPINSNVVGYLVGKHRIKAPQEISAAGITLGMVQYYLDLDVEQIIPVNMAKDKPQCMDQYSRMFAGNREPGEVQDRLVKYQNSKHIIVSAGYRFYKVDVLDDSNTTMIPMGLLTKMLKDIAEDAYNRGPEPFPVGALTGGERTFWAKARQRLANSNPQNKTSLHDIESALFVICLESGVNVSDREVAASTLHGDGRTRWFDKSFNVVIKGDGDVGIHIEHSWADAPVPLDGFFNHGLPYLEEKLNALKRNELVLSAAEVVVGATKWKQPQEIKFDLSNETKKDIREVERFTDAAIADSSLDVVHCWGLGKHCWKQAGLSPDAAVQMAMQLAYRRLHGGNLPVATYETIGMVGWLHGRTECCRVVSNDSERFVKTMMNGWIRTRSEADRLIAEKALRTACDSHLKYIVEGQKGNGIDRHLLGLRLVGKPGSPTPKLFQDPLFARSGSTGSFILSTSNNSYISRPFGGMFGGFGDGYGVCYIPNNEATVLCIECKRSSKVTEGDALRFAKMVNEALIDIALVAGVPLAKSML
jgi:carnitine O-acetyltransferase